MQDAQLKVCPMYDFSGHHLNLVNLSLNLRNACRYVAVEVRHILNHLWLFIDPVELGRLPRHDLFLGEPESNFFLRTLNTIGTVADVSTDIDSVVPTNGARGGIERVGGTEDG
jgi:hypothetical protein